jgi:hypothetical protein
VTGTWCVVALAGVLGLIFLLAVWMIDGGGP